MGEVKKDLGAAHQFVNTKGSERRSSTKVDVISLKGGSIDLSVIPPINRKGTERAPLPSYDGQWEAPDGAGFVYGLLAMLFLWGVGLFLIFWVSNATAEGLHVVHARGKRIAPLVVAKAQFAEAISLINQQTNRGLYAKSFESRRNPWQRIHNNGLSGRATLLYLWKKFFSNRGKIPGLALVPTFNEKGILYAAGYADKCGSVAYATVQQTNQYGADRRVDSIITIAHEVGHLIGADHDDSLPVSIMNSNVIPYSSLGLKFSEKSLNEIRRCRQ